MKAQKVLRCGSCRRKFSVKDVQQLKYFPEISTCYQCCRELQELPILQSCFGKVSQVEAGRVVAYAYDPMATDCRVNCGFRSVCRLFATGEIEKERDLVRAAPPFTKKSLVARAFTMCVKGTTKAKLRRMIEKHDGNFGRILRRLRKGEYGGKVWDLDEVAGRLKIFITGEKKWRSRRQRKNSGRP